MAEKHSVGVPTPRIDGEYKVSGKARYAVDVTFPDMLWGKILRSPISYGRIKSIDTSKAMQVPGVVGILTGEDVAGLRIGRRVVDMPIVADGIVRFIGEKVAAVSAETEDAAEEAAALIEVEYEEMDPVLDPVEAMESSAPLLHPDVHTYKGLPQKLDAPTNRVIYVNWEKGDIEKGFEEADVIVENTFTTPKVHQAYIEPHSCVAKTDPATGAAEIWACSKVPYGIRGQVAAAVQVDPESIVVHPCYIGGDFGGKGDFMDIALCYSLSKKSGGRPVKIVMDYDEEFIAGNPRHASIIKVKTGARKDGTITAHHMDFIFDTGAYCAFKPNGILGGPQKSPGPYNMPNTFVEEHMVYTNQVPCGHMRSPGDPQGFFANESQLDLLAEALGMNPADLRKKNLLEGVHDSPVGEKVDYVGSNAVFDKALEEVKYYEPRPRNVGKGIGLVQWSVNGGKGLVKFRLDETGTLTVSSAMLDQGVGTFTLLEQMAEQELKIPGREHQVRALRHQRRHPGFRPGRQPRHPGLRQRRLRRHHEDPRGVAGGRRQRAGRAQGRPRPFRRAGGAQERGAGHGLCRRGQGQGLGHRDRGALRRHFQGRGCHPAVPNRHSCAPNCHSCESRNPVLSHRHHRRRGE